MTESFDAYYEWLGIPPKDQPPHLYRLLGLEVFESNPAVIENAADRQMAHLRTFQTGRHSQLSQRLLNELAKAKALLLTTDKKAAYDKALRKKLHPEPQAPAPTPPVNLAAPNIDAAVSAQPAPIPAASPSTLGRSPKKKKAPVWQHPAVMAGAISGVVVAIVGFAIFMFSGNGRDNNGGDPDGDGTNVAANNDPKTNGGGANGGDGTGGDGTGGGGQPTDGGAGAATDPHAGTFGVNDPVAAASFGRPDIDTLDMIRLAWGLTSDEQDYALCQVADFEKLEDFTTRMAKYGFRLHQLRPYVFNSKTKFAAIWRQDGRPFRVAVGKTADEIKAINFRLKKQGFSPVDVAGYEVDEGVRYSALWWIPGVGGQETEMTVGMEALESDGLLAKRRVAGWVPASIQYCFPQKGNRVESEIWRRAQGAEDVIVRTGSESKFSVQAKATLPVSVSVAHNRATSQAQFSAVYDKTTTAIPAWETLNTGSPRDTLKAMRDRMKENMEPVALDVGRLWANRKAQLRSVSVWNLRKGALPSSRQRGVMASHGSTGTNVAPTQAATADALLIQGTGGVEVLNTDDITKLGGNFTAELVTRLAQNASTETEQVLMGTSRGEGPLQTGWQLVAKERPGNTTLVEFRYAADQTQTVSRPIPGNFANWRHVAIGCQGTGALWTYTLYLDGQPIVTVPIVQTSLKPANNNLTLGVNPQGSNGLRFYGAMRQFRLSDTERYRQSRFSPATRLTSGEGTISLLDFKTDDSSRMEDLSGGNRAGFRRSTVWLAAGASLPKHPGGSAVASGAPGNTGGNTGGGNTTNVVEVPPMIKRAAPPVKVDIDAAVTQIREVYADDYKRATTTGARVALADVLRKQADEEADPASRYALYKEAANAAAAGGNVGLALSMIDELSTRFDGEYWDERAALVSTAFKSARSRPEKVAVAQSAYDIAQRASSEDEFDVAVKLYDSASAEARRAGDTELAKSINIRSRQVKAVRDEFRVAETARAKVADGTAKADDYLKLGRFLCYLRDDWNNGLPHLAKGSDKTLAKLAADDVKSPTVTKDQSALAEQWKTYADTVKEEDEKKSLLRRAYYWYAAAAPKLTGLAKARVQRVMNEIATQTGGVAIAGTGQKLAFLDVKPGLIHEFNGHTRDIRAIAVSTSGRYMGSASYDGTVRLWDVASGKSLHSLTNAAGQTTYNGLAFTPDERFILAGTSRSSVVAWDVRNGQAAFAISSSADVVDVDVSADGRKVIFGARTSSQPNFGIFGMSKRKPLGFLKSQSYPRFVRISSDGNKALSVDTANNVTLWNLISFRPEGNYAVGSGSVNDVAYSADGRVVAIVTTTDQLLIWNPLSQQLEATLKDTSGFSSSLYAVDLTRDGQHALVADYYKGLVIWDIANEKVVGRVGSDTRRSSNRWRKVKFLPDSRGAIAGDSNGKLALFRLPDF